MPLAEYVAHRSIYTIILVLFILALNFSIFVLMPADPVAILASGRRLRREQVEMLVELWGLRDPLWARFVKYAQSMLTFQFGISYRWNKPVVSLIMERLPNTLILLGASTVIAMIIGIFVGAWAAYRRGSRFDVGVVTASMVTTAFPTFWMGMILIIIFAYYLGLFPMAGAMSRPPPTELWAAVIDRAWHTFLPGLTLALFMYGAWALITRATTLEALTEDYVLTARAKGLSDSRILFRHALRNALLPIVTNAALALAAILGGAILTETVFTYEGLGLLTWDAIQFRDYPLLQALFFIFALATILANFVADIIYGFIDPRIRY